MKLLVDCGNTRLKWALSHPRKPLEMIGAATHGGSDLDHLLAKIWSGFPLISELWLANVAGTAIVQAITHFAEQSWGLSPHLLSSQEECLGVRNGYEDPLRLGVDRWLAMIAAWNKIKTPCMVVDLGTCVTVDVVGGRGQHLGGVIVPGVQLMQEAIQLKTAGVHWEPGAVLKNQPDQLLGTNTQAAVYMGTTLMQAAYLERLYYELKPEFRLPVTVLLTGGGGEAVAPLLRIPQQFHPHLVLEGIALVSSLKTQIEEKSNINENFSLRSRIESSP